MEVRFGKFIGGFAPVKLQNTPLDLLERGDGYRDRNTSNAPAARPLIDDIARYRFKCEGEPYI